MSQYLENRINLSGMDRLIQSNKNLSLSSFVGLPSYRLKYKPNTNLANASIRVFSILTLSIRPLDPEAARTIEWAKTCVTIYESDRYLVVKRMSEILENIRNSQNLFYIDENNKPILNAECANDSQYLIKVFFNHKIPKEMWFVPTVVMEGGSAFEGVRIILNHRSVCADLTLLEFTNLMNLIASFSYQMEPLLCLEALSKGHKEMG